MSVWIFRKTRTKGKKSGCYVMEWKAPNGEKKRESTGTGNKETAKRIARQKEDELALDPWGLVRVKREPKVWDEFVQEFIGQKRSTKRAGTATAYTLTLAAVARLLGPRNVADVATMSALEKFVQARSSEVSPQTVNKDLRGLRAALRYAEKKGHIPIAPSFADAWIKVDKKDPVCRRRCRESC